MALAETIGAVKLAVEAAAAKLPGEDGGHPKLSKQLGKLQAVMDLASEATGAMPAERAEKLHKQLVKVSERLDRAAGEGADGEKIAEKLPRRLRASRAKITKLLECDTHKRGEGKK